MHPVSSLVEQIHTRALAAASSYRRAEADLIEVLQQVEEHGVYLKRGHSSLFHYVVEELGLSENVTYSLILIARKSRTIPELKSRIQSGEITLSNARRIVPLLTATNQEDWLEKAATLSNRRLEKEIATVRPESATPERASYTSADRVRLELGLSEREMLRFRRVQDLLSQARKRPVSLEEALETLTAEYLRRHDPVERAKRHQVRHGFSSPDTAGTPSESAGAEVGRETSSPDDSGLGEVRSTDDSRLREVHTPNDSMPRDAKPIQNAGNRLHLDQTVSLGKLVTLPITPLDGTVPARPDTNLKGTVSARSITASQGIASTGPTTPLLHRRIPRRLPIPARILHQVNLRDHRRCTFPLPDGKFCGQSRWIEIHHLVPVSAGGTNDLENLITLCSAHHRLQHLNSSDGSRIRKGRDKNKGAV